jgi:hypothetical protein
MRASPFGALLGCLVGRAEQRMVLHVERPDPHADHSTKVLAGFTRRRTLRHSCRAER